MNIKDALPYIVRVDSERGWIWIATAAADALLRFYIDEERFEAYPFPSPKSLVRHMELDADSVRSGFRTATSPRSAQKSSRSNPDPRQSHRQLLTPKAMLRNYLKISFRHMARERGYSIINVLGLAIGMACCLLIVLFVREELSYDEFHERGERIVRLIRETSALSAAPMGPALAHDLPEGREYVRLDHVDEVTVERADGQTFSESIIAADSSFFNVLLDHFAYHIEPGVLLFIAAGAAAMAAALTSVAYQAMRAATRDPVRSLRYE